MCNSSSPRSPTARIDGRPVLQPAYSNRISVNPNCQTSPRKSVKKLIDSHNKVSLPVSPKPAATPNKPNGLRRKKKSKSIDAGNELPVPVPDAITTEYRQKGSLTHGERKSKVACYGRIGSLKNVEAIASNVDVKAEKRCSFITPNSDPVYVAYHDEEWGAPVHEDRMLFELLVLSGAQVGSDWTTILKRRNEFREAFAGFDAEIVAQYTGRKIGSLSEKYGLDMTFVRGVVDNANKILQVRLQLGSFDKYLWGFVNHKPLSPGYTSARKIPAKTSKSEAISKDMVRRGFRLAGPTVVHSFMQAAGLTNDHLISCRRHRDCSIIGAV